MLRTSMQTHHAQADQVQTPHPKNFPEHTPSSWVVALLPPRAPGKGDPTPPHPHPVLLEWEDTKEGQQEVYRCPLLLPLCVSVLWKACCRAQQLTQEGSCTGLSTLHKATEVAAAYHQTPMDNMTGEVRRVPASCLFGSFLRSQPWIQCPFRSCVMCPSHPNR